MYYEYFGFRQPPFKITPDTNLFYPGGDRGAILEALLYAVLNGEGIIKVVGEVGSGKTMLCRMLEKELPDKVEVVYLVNPSIAPENTLHAIAFELKLGIQSSTSRFEVMNLLQQYLLQRHSQNRQVVVFVEEAQSMPIATLEEIRLLSNLETQQSKLLQIVLFGQPELDEMIALPEIRQLKERITYSFQLSPFKTNDIREYINTRVRACGHRAGDLFSDAAIQQIEHYSKGLLRRINILADKSLLAAFADNSHKVSVKHTQLAARDSEFVGRSFWTGKLKLVAASILVVLIVLGSLLLIQRPPHVETTLDTTADTPSLTTPITGQTGNNINTPTPVQTDTESTVSQTINTATPLNNGNPSVQADTTEKQDVELINPDLPDDKAVSPAVVTTVQSVSTVVTDPVPIKVPQTDSLTSAETTTVDNNQAISEPETVTATQQTQTPTTNLENNDISTNIEENKLFSEQNSLPDNTQNSPENQLLGLSAVHQFQDFEENNLNPKEMEIFQNQLLKNPPESAENQNSSRDSDICQRCWSIIYRPVPIIKNL